MWGKFICSYRKVCQKTLLYCCCCCCCCFGDFYKVFLNRDRIFEYVKQSFIIILEGFIIISSISKLCARKPS